MPFLGQVHGDPEDYQRWTSTKFRLALENAGFEVVQIEPMGSVFSVVFDLFVASTVRWQQMGSNKLGMRIVSLGLRTSRPLWLSLDRMAIPFAQWITTGWAATVKVPTS